MLFCLHQTTICLDSQAQQINEQWRELLVGWVKPGQYRPFSIHFSLQLAHTLPPLPSTPPIFTDHHVWPGGVGILTVYSAETGHTNNPVYLLHFQDGALVQVNVAQRTVSGVILPAALVYGRFQDITFTALAPLLRQQGYYLLHGFAASKNGRSLLLVGPSGSGKTTAGLALMLAGWELLANDMVLLQKRGEQIEALPMPDRITVRHTSWELLPQLRSQGQNLPVGQKWLLAGAKPHQQAAPVSAVFFPQVTTEAKTAVQPQNRALALAHLMEESIDQWDIPALPTHLELLQTLSQQATVHVLHLGQDVSHWATLLPTITL